jgi:hypothetical protein
MKVSCKRFSLDQGQSHKRVRLRLEQTEAAFDKVATN